MSVEQKDTYFVAVKVFLEKDGKLLILRDKFGDWDLPGGRIRKDEFTVSLDEVIKRKMLEELGDEIQYEIGEAKVFMRHQRVEQVPGLPTVRIFALGYAGVLKSGIIHLSDLHIEMLWVSIDTFDPAKYFEGGWLTGVEEYLKVRRNR
ncbi:MAG: NUDIX domain-containing protein [Patescibacteria group bacterium]|jgi:8-oxo-dGTP pyrophosphatase MutT (NUDIX family)